MSSPSEKSKVERIKDIAIYLQYIEIASAFMGLPKLNQITHNNFKLPCETPGYHFIKLDEEDDEMEYTLNAYSRSKEMRFPLVTDLLIDFCGYKSKYHFDRKAIGMLFPKLKSLKLIRCAQDIQITLPKSLEDLTTLEIYSTGNIILCGDKELEDVRLCSIQGSIELLPWDHFDLEHGKKYKYYAKKVEINTFDRGCIDLGTRKDFVPNLDLLF